MLALRTVSAILLSGFERSGVLTTSTPIIVNDMNVAQTGKSLRALLSEVVHVIRAGGYEWEHVAVVEASASGRAHLHFLQRGHSVPRGALNAAAASAGAGWTAIQPVLYRKQVGRYILKLPLSALDLDPDEVRPAMCRHLDSTPEGSSLLHVPSGATRTAISSEAWGRHVGRHTRRGAMRMDELDPLAPGPEWDGVSWPSGPDDPDWAWLRDESIWSAIGRNVVEYRIQRLRSDPRRALPEIPCPSRGGVDVIRKLREHEARLDPYGTCHRNACGVCGAVKAFKTAKAIGLSAVAQSAQLESVPWLPEEAEAFRRRVRAFMEAVRDGWSATAVSAVVVGGDGKLHARLLLRDRFVPVDEWHGTRLFDLRVTWLGGARSNVISDARWLLSEPLRAYDAVSDRAAVEILRRYSSANGGRLLTTHGKFWRMKSGQVLDNVEAARRVVALDWQQSRG